MAQLRLIVWLASAALALSACRASEAGPTSGLTPPADWKPLPDLATAVTEAARLTSINVEAIETWGEPARGCYAAWMALRAAIFTPRMNSTIVVTTPITTIAMSCVPSHFLRVTVTASKSRAPRSRWAGGTRKRIPRR
jgi:hypothetical protein